MKHTIFLVTLFIIAASSLGLSKNKRGRRDVSIFPSPASVKQRQVPYTLSEKTQIVISQDSDELRQVGEFLAGYLRPATGYELQVVKDQGEGSQNNIYLVATSPKSTKPSYSLTITPSEVKIKGTSCEAVFHGIQSFRQVLPPEIESDQTLTNIAWKTKSLKISDEPGYGWRGFMMDSGRQYHTIEHLKKTLDWMAYLKLNVLHWHLTENIGWRLEIKKYPKLVSIGSKGKGGAEQDGYYTQEEVGEIVEYARKRYIDIMPEIEIPGHCYAVIKSCPEVSCFTDGANGPRIFCAGDPEVHEFLTNVLAEVCEIFPYEYIHIGGDEAVKKAWEKCPDCQAMMKEEGLANVHELQMHMSNRLADFLKSKGRKAVVWGDVLCLPGPELRDNIVVQWWNYRGSKYTSVKAALQRGHKVLLSPNYYTYVNFPVEPWKGYDKHRTFNIQDAYEKNPVVEVTEMYPDNRDSFLGISASLWADYTLTQDMLDIRTFPRIYALAELMWNVESENRQPFEEFYTNVKKQYKRLELMGHKIGPGMLEEKLPVSE